jgi:oxygen-independent coproporphyrinogen-3 oxidase
VEREASLYVHVPFCAGVCDYCDFYSLPVLPGDSRLDRFVDRLLAELENRLDHFHIRRIPTVYIGGGTPSVLGASRLDRLLGGMAGLLPGSEPGKLRVPECTLEVNPESADEELLRVCRDRGITRLSVGVQSFHGPSRRAVHRAGDPSLIEGRLSLIAEIFGDDFSADLMAALPLQDESVLLQDIAKLLSFGPGHISLYALTVEDHTPLARAAARGRVSLPEGDEADRIWLAGCRALEEAGYAQYEVSNFSRPGKEGRHNIRYWRMENWLGLGPGASGTVIDDEGGTGFRYTLPPDADAWLEGPSDPVVERLDRRVLIKETLLMGFRYTQGPGRELFQKRFHRNPEDLIPETLSRWAGRGLLREDRRALNKKGLLFLNAFLVQAFAELDSNGKNQD